MEEAIINKIQNLLERTTENGCTEAESLTAIKKAGDLMTKYNISLEQITDYKEDYILDFIDTGKKKIDNYNCLLPKIERFTDTLIYIQAYRRETRKYFFFGAKKDVIFAKYLFLMLEKSVKFQLETFKKSDAYKKSPSHGRILVNNFLHGIIFRVGERMDIIKEKILRDAGSIDLYDRGKLAKEKFKQFHSDIDLEDGNKNNQGYSGDAYQFGKDSAENINLNRPLNGNSEDFKQLKAKEHV